MQTKTLLILPTFVGLLLSFNQASAQTSLFLPPDAGEAPGSGGFADPARGFDDQPLLSDLIAPSNDVVVPGGNLGQGVPGDANRTGYIDFGTGFASVEIKELWTAYNQFATVSPAVPYHDLWWSDTNDATRGAPGTFTDINESAFNFGTISVTSVPGGEVRWTQDFDFGLSPVTPAHRYLLLETDASGFAAGRATEFAIVAVPEPSAFALIFGCAAVGSLMIRRRRRN